MLRKVGIKRKPMKPWRRSPEDRVPDWLPGYLLGRDRECIPARLGADDPCSGRLTIEHVKFESMTGKRAPSDKFHTMLACLHHNLTWCLLSESKDLERDYLRRVEWPAEDVA